MKWKEGRKKNGREEEKFYFVHIKLMYFLCSRQNPADPNVVSATYRPIRRNGETRYSMGSSVVVSPGAKITDELLEVDFLLKDGKHVKEHFLHVVPHEYLVKEEAKKPPGIPLNILIMAIDSVSHTTAKRKLPKIYEFLRNEMGAFFFNGHSVTGDGTVEQMAPMLTGMKFFEELYEARPDRGNSRTVDGWPWIYSHLKGRFNYCYLARVVAANRELKIYDAVRSTTRPSKC